MKQLIDGAIGLEIVLQQGISRYPLQNSNLLEDKKLLYVSFCNSNDVPKTPSGNSTLMVGAENLTLKLVDKFSQECSEYSMTNIEWHPEQLVFGQALDFEKSELILNNLDNPKYYHNRSVYLIFWFGEKSNISLPDLWKIVPLEIKINGHKTFFGQNNGLKNKKFTQLQLSFPGFTPSGEAVVDRTFIANKFITLSCQNKILFLQIPLFFFHLSHSKNPFYFNFLSFDFENSFVESLTTNQEDWKSLFFNLCQHKF